MCIYSYQIRSSLSFVVWSYDLFFVVYFIFFEPLFPWIWFLMLREWEERLETEGKMVLCDWCFCIQHQFQLILLVINSVKKVIFLIDYTSGLFAGPPPTQLNHGNTLYTESWYKWQFLVILFANSVQFLSLTIQSTRHKEKKLWTINKLCDTGKVINISTFHL